MKPTTKTGAPNTTLLEGQERDCCKDDVTKPPSDQTETCVDGWEAKSKQAENDLKTASALKAKAEQAYKNASDWEGKLKAWKENAITANGKLLDVCSELSRWAPIVDRLGQNTEKTVEAIEALLCLVKKIFDDIDDVLRTSTSDSVPKNKGKLQDLKEYLECDKGIKEEDKQKALASIAPYEKKMQDISALMENVLDKLLETFTDAALLAAKMDGSQESPGLKWQIGDLDARLCGEKSSDQKVATCGCTCPDAPEKPPGPPCGNDVSLPTPPTLLPIIDPQDPTKGSDYYVHLTALYAQATSDTAKYRTEMEAAKKASDAAAARKSSLDAAIKAAQDAKGAK